MPPEADPTPAPTPTPAPAPEAKWYEGYDAETQAQITNLGLADKTPAEAAQALAKSYREAQAYIGVPKAGPYKPDTYRY